MLLICCNAVFPQSAAKKAIAFDDMKDWMSLSRNGMSPNGKYVFYSVENERPDAEVLHVKSLDNSWKIEYLNMREIKFSADGKLILMIDPQNNLIIHHLGTVRSEKIAQVSEYELFSYNGSEWIVCKKADMVMLRNVSRNQSFDLPGFNQFKLSPSGKYLVVFDRKQDRGFGFVDVENPAIIKRIAADMPTENESVMFNRSETAFVFTAKVHQTGVATIYRYDIKTSVIAKILDDNHGLLAGRFTLSPVSRFLAGGKSLVFSYVSISKDTPPAKTLKAAVNVYSYTDSVPYTVQKGKSMFNMPKEYKGIIRLSDLKIIYADSNDVSMTPVDGTIDDLAYVFKRTPSGALTSGDNYLISSLTGERIIKCDMDPWYQARCSPDGRFLLSGRYEDSSMYCFDRSSNTLRNLLQGLGFSTGNVDFDKGGKRRIRLEAYVKNTTYVLITDNFDLWMLDMSGVKAPMNLTGGYGQKNGILFKVSGMNFLDTPRRDLYYDVSPAITQAQLDDLILSSYDYHTANNDYYKLHHKAGNKLERCTAGDYMYEEVQIWGNIHRGGRGDGRMRNASNYLVIRESAAASRNLYSTYNFKDFTPITDIHPEKRYNWLTAEVMTVQLKSGIKKSGVMYKPENFDPSKKYPVILFYYQKMSQDAFRYRTPELSRGVISIPYYVSNGYIVYTPDLPNGEGMSDTYDRVLEIINETADKLAAIPYIDASKMAIHGHSWGGFETNYILANTTRFAAAVSASGGSDLIAKYAMPTHGNTPYEGGPWLGDDVYADLGPLEKNLELYLKSSAKLHAGRVTTPVLFMHNEKDQAVHFYHSLGFFNTLSLMKKKAWLLAYDNEEHTIENPDNQLDFTIRMKQFFDHYLMNKPAPRWMTNGLPYYLKQVESRYETKY